jgi:hypothetical protein
LLQAVRGLLVIDHESGQKRPDEKRDTNRCVKQSKTDGETCEKDDDAARSHASMLVPFAQLRSDDDERGKPQTCERQTNETHRVAIRPGQIKNDSDQHRAKNYEC